MVMPAIEDDLGFLLSVDDFAENVVVFFATGKRKTIRVIFDNEHVQADEIASVSAFVEQKKLICRTSDLDDDLAVNDRITVRDVDYYVAYFMDDRTGVTEIYLSTGTI